MALSAKVTEIGGPPSSPMHILVLAHKTRFPFRPSQYLSALVARAMSKSAGVVRLGFLDRLSFASSRVRRVCTSTTSGFNVTFPYLNSHVTLLSSCFYRTDNASTCLRNRSHELSKISTIESFLAAVVGQRLESLCTETLTSLMTLATLARADSSEL